MSNELIKEEGKLTEEMFENFLMLQEKINEKAEEVLKEINTVKKIEGYSHLYVRNMDSGTIDFYGEEYYCGSTDSYEFSMPSYLIYDNEGKEKYLERLRNEEIEKLRKKEEYEFKQEELIREKEKRLLMELQKKYGNNE